MGSSSNVGASGSPVNSGATSPIKWEDLGVALPIPGSPAYQNTSTVNESSSVNTASGISAVFAQDDVSQTQKSGAGATSNYVALTSDPNLAVPNQNLLNQAATSFNLVKSNLASGQAPAENAPPAQKQAYNSWLNVSATVTLFTLMSDIASLVSQMALQESKMKQAMGSALISMAKESMNLTIQAGDARAQQMEADARQSMVEFGLAIGQIATTITSTVATQIKESKTLNEMSEEKGDQPLTVADRLKAREYAGSTTEVFSKISESMFDAIKSATSASTNLQKASLERSASLAEGVKQLLDKVFQMVMDTYGMLGDDMKDQRATIKDLFSMVQAAFQTRTEQWKA